MRRPRASSRQPIDAAARPFPSEDTTPPVTKMYFADIAATSSVVNLGCAWCARPSISQPIFHRLRPGRIVESMAALAQPDVVESAILDIVRKIPLPEGIRFERLEFRENSVGDPAVFVVYSLADSAKSDQERAKEIVELDNATLNPLWSLPIPWNPY